MARRDSKVRASEGLPNVGITIEISLVLASVATTKCSARQLRFGKVMITNMLQSVRRYLPIILALLCVATVLPGLFLSFEDSEIWGITSSRRIIDNPLTGSSAHFKPLFSVLFGSIAAVANSNWSALMASRWLAISFAAGGLFSMYSLGLVFTRSNRSRFVTVSIYAIVCTMPLLLLHFTKARSDAVSASIVLIAGFLLAEFESRSTTLRGFFYLISAGVAILITPKSIDLAAALGVIFYVTEFRHGLESETGFKSQPKNSTFLRIAWAISPFVAVLLIGLLVSREFLVKSFIYWLDTYKGVNLFQAAIWGSFQQSIVTAWIPSILIFIGLVIGLFGFRRLVMREKALVVIGWLVAGFITLHSQKYLFFLASRVPFLALGALPGLHLIYEYLATRFKLRANVMLAGFTIILLASLTVTGIRLSSYPAFRISEQKAVYLLLEQYLDRTKVTRYWDAIGLFPIRNTVFHYPSPSDRENSEMLRYVETSRPSLILRTSKMELLEPFFMMWLLPRYAAVNPQIYARFQVLEPGGACVYSVTQLLKKAEAEMFQQPLALIKRVAADRAWIRVPFETRSGLGLSVLTAEAAAEEIRLNQCSKAQVQYAITEAGPWDGLPAPAFSRSFGYDGRL